MNLLADESVDRLIVERLRADGHAVEAVAETDPSITDEDVLRRAAESNRVLVTADKDFGELVYRLGRAHAGVVLLRLAGLPSADRAELSPPCFAIMGRNCRAGSPSSCLMRFGSEGRNIKTLSQETYPAVPSVC